MARLPLAVLAWSRRSRGDINGDLLVIAAAITAWLTHPETGQTLK